MAKTKVDYRKAERAYRGLWGIFIGLIVIVLAMICFFYVFLVRTIRIVGNERYTSEEVIQMSGLPYEESMFLIDKEQIRNNLETSPYLEVKEITRIWPFTVRITVHERVAVAYTEYGDNRLVLDEKGYILTKDGIYYQDTLVKVTGWKISEANIGEKIVTEEPSIANSYATIMMKLGEYELLDRVDAGIIKVLIDASSPAAVSDLPAHAFDLLLIPSRRTFHYKPFLDPLAPGRHIYGVIFFRETDPHIRLHVGDVHHQRVCVDSCLDIDLILALRRLRHPRYRFQIFFFHSAL